MVVVDVEDLYDDVGDVDVALHKIDEIGVQDEIVAPKLVEDEVHDGYVKDEGPDAGLKGTSCTDVLHKTVVVGLDLQDDVVVVDQVQIVEQDVQVEDKDIDERLEDTLKELAILDADEVV